MLSYSKTPNSQIEIGKKTIGVFTEGINTNIDKDVVNAFGKEWTKFNTFTDEEILQVGNEYFDIVDERILNKDAIVLDLGCGTGRWTKYMAGRVKHVELIDPSEAIFAAANLLSDFPNTRMSMASADNIPFEDNSFDFAISLGVLHHIPDTVGALQKMVDKVKPGGYVLLYLYYALDNRGPVFRWLFRTANFFRKIISSMPSTMKLLVCDVIAILVYMPLILLARLTKMLLNNGLYKRIPLSYYHNKSFHIIRNDALDRFGTSLEKRFTKQEILQMMNSCGLTSVQFSPNSPYWHAVGKKQGASA